VRHFRKQNARTLQEFHFLKHTAFFSFLPYNTQWVLPENKYFLYIVVDFYTHTPPSATGITGIMPASALPHVGLYSSNVCGLRHYPTQTEL
jgi:hypothetical protein